MHDMYVLGAENHEGDQDDRDDDRSTNSSRHGRHRNDPDLSLSQNRSRGHSYKRKDSTAKNQNIRRETLVNLTIHTLLI